MNVLNMKNHSRKANRIRLALAIAAGIAASGTLSSCAGMWLSTDTGFDLTQPGGFGIDIGLSGPLGGFGAPETPPPPPPPGGPGGPPPGDPIWGPY